MQPSPLAPRRDAVTSAAPLPGIDATTQTGVPPRFTDPCPPANPVPLPPPFSSLIPILPPPPALPRVPQPGSRPAPRSLPGMPSGYHARPLPAMVVAALRSSSAIAIRFTMLCVLALTLGAALPATAQVPNITYAIKTSFGSGLRDINSMVGDSAGNVFFTDFTSGALYEETLNSDATYTQSVISTGATRPVYVAIDSSNNLYVADGSHTVYKETLSGGSYTESIVSSTFSQVYGLAIDAAGDVYVLDAGTGSIYKETLVGGTYTRSTVVGGLSLASGGAVAVDTAGNVYIAETANSRALKETLSGGSYTQSVVADSTTFNFETATVAPYGIAVDATGTVLLASPNYGIFKAVPNGTSYTTTPEYIAGFAGILAGASASLDAHGNLYLADATRGYVASVNELAESAGPQNFGSQNVGTAAAAQTATFTFDAGGTLAAIPYAVSTQGDLTLDFQPAATQPANVCVTGHTYNVGDTCTVAATFTPTRPGVRYGAIALFATSGTPIATSFLQGIGVSAQVSFSPGALNTGLGSTFGTALAADSSSNIVFSPINANVSLTSFTKTHPLEIISSNFTTGYTGPTINSSSGNFFGSGYVVDGAGNVIYANGYTSASSSSQGATFFQAYDVNPNLAPTIQTGTTQMNETNYGNAFLASVPFPFSTIAPPTNNRPAVDGAGNLYFADDGGNQIIEEHYVRGAYNQLTVVMTGLNNPGDVVVDAAGAVYAIDTGNNRIVKETPNGDGTYTQSVVDSSFASAPEGLAIDRLGNLYVSLFNNFTNNNIPFIVKETLADGAYTPANLTITGSEALDVDAAGNVFALHPASSSSTFISNVGALDVATPPSFIFASTAVGSTSSDSPKTVTIANNGNAPLSFTNLAITSGFTLSSGSTCTNSTTLAPNATCTLLINFVPTQGGVINGTLTLSDNHLGNTASTQIIHLNGQATGGSAVSAATLTPPTMSFATVAGTASAAQTATLTNTSTLPLSISSIAIVANNPSPAVRSVSPHDALPSAFSQTNTCGAGLQAGSSCTITLTFNPSAAGTDTAYLAVTDSAGSTAIPTVVSTGVHPNDQVTSTQAIALTGVATANSGTGPTSGTPQASLTPVTGSFGSVTVGSSSAAQVFTLSNPGTAALPITGFGISGTNSSSFQQGASNCGSSLAAGSSCTIAVAFAPTAAGSLGATLSINDSVGTQSAALSGTGTAAPVAQATLTPATANFGTVTNGSSSAAQTFTLTNPGTAALAVTSVTLGGANASAYALANNTCGTSLAAGATCTATVTFKPTAAATFAASLVVVDSVGTQSSTLTGIGAAATPGTADFTIAATPATQSSYRNTTVSYPVQLGSVSSSNLFTSAVSLSVTGLPAGATAAFSPATVTPGSGATSTLTVSIPGLYAVNRTPTVTGRELAFTGISAAALMLGLFTRRKRLPVRLLLLLCALGVLSAGAIGCGSGNGFAVGTSTSNLVITGTSGTLTHTTSVSLTVQ